MREIKHSRKDHDNNAKQSQRSLLRLNPCTHTRAHQNKRTRGINTALTSAPAVRCRLSAPLQLLLLLLRQSRYPEGCTHCNEKSTNRDTRGSVSPVSQCMHLEGFGWVAGAQRSIVLQYKRKKRQKKEEKKQTGLVTSSKGTGKGKRSNATGAAAVRMSLDVSLVSPSPSMLCSPLSPQNLICKHDSTHSRYSPHVFLAMLRIFCSVSLFRPNSPFSLAALSFASTRRTTSSLLAWSLMAVCWLL